MHLIGVIEQSSDEQTLMLSKSEPSAPCFPPEKRACLAGPREAAGLRHRGVLVQLQGVKATWGCEKVAATAAGAPWLWSVALSWAWSFVFEKAAEVKS